MKNHFLSCFLIFICSLVVGYAFSIKLYHLNINILSVNISPGTNSSSKSIPTLGDGQRNILLVTTTSVNTLKPKLQGIWLVTYLPTDSNIRLLPIYPADDSNLSALDEQLNTAFGLHTENGSFDLDQDFTDLLKRENFWWSGYLIFDDVALTKIINLLGGIQMNGQTFSREQVMTDLHASIENPNAAYDTEVAILQSACHRISSIDPNPDISQFLFSNARHLLSDLDPSQLRSEIEFLFQNGHRPICRFPTLEISQMIP